MQNSQNNDILDKLFSKLRTSVEYYIDKGLTLEQMVQLIKQEQVPLGIKIATNQMTTEDGERLAVLIIGILYRVYGKN